MHFLVFPRDHVCSLAASVTLWDSETKSVTAPCSSLHGFSTVTTLHLAYGGTHILVKACSAPRIPTAAKLSGVGKIATLPESLAWP